MLGDTVPVSRIAVRWAVLVAVGSLVLLLAVAVAMSGGYADCTSPATGARYEPTACPADHHWVAIGVAVGSSGSVAVSGVLLWRSLRNGTRRSRHERPAGRMRRRSGTGLATAFDSLPLRGPD